MPKPTFFEVDEMVLAEQPPLIYKAKILKVNKTKPYSYFVHYDKWNKKWDEWIKSDRVIKLDAEGLALQKERKATEKNKPKSEKRKAPRSKLNKPASMYDAEMLREKKKRKKDTDKELEDYSEDPEITLVTSVAVKRILVDDYYNVIHSQKLRNLPSERTVSTILKEFMVARTKTLKKKDVEVYEVFVEALKTYFEKALGSILLYRFERPQYDDLVSENPDIKVSDIYGAEHLCRLFMKLPYLLTRASMDDKDMHRLQIRLNDLLRFLGKESFDEKNYVRATDKYTVDFINTVKPISTE